MLKIDQAHAAPRNSINKEVVPIHVPMDQPKVTMKPAKQGFAALQIVGASSLPVYFFQEKAHDPATLSQMSEELGCRVICSGVGYDGLPAVNTPTFHVQFCASPIQNKRSWRW